MKSPWDAINDTIHPEAPNDTPYESPDRLADIRNERIPAHVREQHDADRLWEQQHLGRPTEQGVPSVGPTGASGWYPLAAAIKAANPSWVASQIAIQLKLDHGLDISNASVRNFLKARSSSHG